MNANDHDGLFLGLKQGDVVRLTSGNLTGCSLEAGEFAIISQTCDVRKEGRNFVSVAPVITIGSAERSFIKKGRKPLLIPVGTSGEHAANLEKVHSIPRESFLGSQLVEETVRHESGEDASFLSARIGRAYSRAALPDEVNLVMGKFSEKLQERYFKNSPVAEALDLLADIRIGCDDWNRPGRELTLYYLVPSTILAPQDFIDPKWNWANSKIVGLDPGTIRCEDLSLDRAAQLICDNTGSDTSLGAKYALWERYADFVRSAYLQERLNDEVIEVYSEVVSTQDFSYDEFLRSESLEFTALSYSGRPGSR